MENGPDPVVSVTDDARRASRLDAQNNASYSPASILGGEGREATRLREAGTLGRRRIKLHDLATLTLSYIFHHARRLEPGSAYRYAGL